MSRISREASASCDRIGQRNGRLAWAEDNGGDPTQFFSYLAIMSLFSFMFPFMWMCELHASMFAHYVSGYQRRASDVLHLKRQRVVSCLVVLGLELGVPWKSS